MMNRRKIREGYDLIRPTYEQKERMLDNILNAASPRTPAGKDVPMKNHKRRPLLIAAIAAMMLLLVGCTAVVAMNLNELRIGEYSYTQPAWINADGERFEEMQITKNVISLQGIAGSNNQKAAQEWYEFDQSYDPDHAILYASDDFQAPRAYDAYSVYSQEMVDKVDEIAEKYGLKLAGQNALVKDWSRDIFYDALGIESLFVEDAPIKIEFGSGYFYECGNFNMEMGCQVNDESFQWDNTLWVSVSYRDKAYLDTVFTYLDKTEEWTYTLVDGTELLMVQVENTQAGSCVYVFCDREDAFVTAQIYINYFNNDGTVESMSKEDIELAVSLIDFSVKPQNPDMAEALKKLEAADKAYQEKFEAKMAEMGDPFRVGSYKELTGMYSNGTYLLVDLNHDGIEECILWNEYDYGDVYTMIGGKTEPIMQLSSEMYLCEGNIIETYEEVGEAYYIHGYLKMEGNKLVWQDRIVFDRANKEWSKSSDGIIQDEVIDQEEAERIMGSYIRTDVEMKPVSELQ